MLDIIPKSRVITLMTDWGSGKITTEEMSLWCCNNFAPGSQSPDPSIPEWQQRAVYHLLQAFEWQAHDGRPTAKRDGWEKAIELLNCTAEGYQKARAAFDRDCAGVSVSHYRKKAP